MSYEPDRDPYADQDGFDSPDPYGGAVAQKTNLPGIFLIMVGVLNLFFALFLVLNAALLVLIPDAQLAAQNAKTQEMFEKKFGFAKEDLERSKQTPTQQRITSVALAMVVLVGALLPLLAGFKMRSLRSYGLCVTGAIVAALPGVSCMSCPCGVGLPVALWALVVLLNADVKAAFR
jgi:hypothetical protein